MHVSTVVNQFQIRNYKSFISPCIILSLQLAFPLLLPLRPTPIFICFSRCHFIIIILAYLIIDDSFILSFRLEFRTGSTNLFHHSLFCCPFGLTSWTFDLALIDFNFFPRILICLFGHVRSAKLAQIFRRISEQTVYAHLKQQII